MPIHGPFDSLFHLGGAALGAAGLMVVLWALFRDRSRGRRRCARCWYDMTGTPGLRCPECGRMARSERGLHRTRRRWGRAAAAGLAMFVAAALAAVPGYRAGWQTLVPTTLLALVAPADDPTSATFVLAGAGGTAGSLAAIPILGSAFTPATPAPSQMLTDEMWQRIAEGRAAAWQMRFFVRRYFSAHPPHFAGAITLPPRWPLGVPLPARTGNLIPSAFTQAGIDARIRLEGSKETGRDGLIGAATSVADQVPIVVELVKGSAVVYSQRLTKPCEVRPNDEQFLDRLGGQPLDSQIARALEPKLAWRPTRGGLFIACDRTGVPPKILELCTSFDIELHLGPDVLARGHGIAEWNLRPTDNWADIDPEWVPDGTDRAIAARESHAGMTFVLQGDPAAALRQYLDWPWGKRPACWVGRVEVPVPG